MAIATQVLFFDNFGALESHLQSLYARYSETASKYREVLGEMMRRSNQGGGEEEKWSQEMAATISGAEKPEAPKKSMSKMLSKKDKPAPDAGWVLFDPFSVFVGQGVNGQAELYFDAINQLDDTTRKLKLAIDILETLRAKASAPAGVSMTVSFVNDVPSRMILKPAETGAFKKKSWTFSFAVPPVKQALAFPQA